MKIEQLREKIRKESKIKLKLYKELLEMRKRVRLLVSMEEYDEAEMVENKANTLEVIETEKIEEKLEEIILKQKEKLRRKQQLALSALLKRIQRNRNEKLKHRQMDSQRLIQRNKNLLLDLLKKQNMEIRRTRSPANPNYPKPKHYVDPNDAKLNFSKNKTPYYDPVSKTVKVPGKDTKVGNRRKPKVGNKKKKGKSKESQEKVINPQPITNE